MRKNNGETGLYPASDNRRTRLFPASQFTAAKALRAAKCIVSDMRKLTSFAQNAVSALLCTSIPIGAPTAAKVPPRLMLFECSSGLDLTVAIGKDVAKVSLPERALVLRHGSSRLGLRFSSNEGTLIIDGDFASLILRNDRRFGSCRSRGKAA